MPIGFLILLGYIHIGGFRSACRLGRAAGRVLPLQTKQARHVDVVGESGRRIAPYTLTLTLSAISYQKK